MVPGSFNAARGLWCSWCHCSSCLPLTKRTPLSVTYKLLPTGCVAVCGTAKTSSCWSQQASSQPVVATHRAKGYGIKIQLTPSPGIFPPGNVLLYYRSSYCISQHVHTSYKGNGCKLSRLLIPHLIKLVLQILDVFCFSFSKNEFVLQICRKQLFKIHRHLEDNWVIYSVNKGKQKKKKSSTAVIFSSYQNQQCFTRSYCSIRDTRNLFEYVIYLNTYFLSSKHLHA